MNILNAIFYQPLFNVLIFLVAVIPGNQVGWAIIALTTIIRTLLLPITVHTARVQVRMRTLQPKIDAVRKKHEKDRTLQSQAMMELYKEEGVSPFSSCLPLIIQVVVLVILYNVFRNGLNTSHFSLLYSFTPRPGALNTHFLGIDLAKPDVWILPIVAGITQYFQARVTIVPSANPKDPMASFSKQMVYIAPIMTFVFARSFPAALPLYWSVTNLFSIAQQEYVLKRQGLVQGAVPTVITKAEQKDDAKERQASAKEAVKETFEKKKGGVTVTVRKRA